LGEGGTEDDAPGWHAIDSALAVLYPGQEPPHHYGTAVPYRFGGPDPIDGISVYIAGSPDHWHFVTYGFSELFAKEGDDPETSGYGFELTFRLARREPKPPVFALNFLQNLGRYVFGTGRVFESGHHMDLNGPLEADGASAITAIVFARDPELPPMETPNGRVEFLQVVGLTEDELLAVKAWDTNRFVALLAERTPRLVTDLDRASFLRDPEFARRVGECTAEEGSSTGTLFVDKLAYQQKQRKAGDERQWLIIGANSARGVLEVLPSRIRHGRELEVRGPDALVTFEPGTRNAVVVEEESLRVSLNEAGLAELLGAIRPQRGERELKTLPALVIEVVPTEITDQSGGVLRVVG
jgi:hypothetical protein